MALLDNKNPTTKQVALKNGVLQTNGALVSIDFPSGWSASQSSKSNGPGFPPETIFVLKNGEVPGVSIGLYFSGIVDKEIDGQIRKKDLFDKSINLKAGTPEARQLVGRGGANAKETQMQDLLFAAGRHIVDSDEKYCRAIKSTDFNGLKSVIFEFENDNAHAKTVEYCIDVLGTGRVIYILYYRAPIETFAENMDTAVSTFRSTVWRKDFDPMIPLDVVE
jgi:hypothetical protein